MHDRRHAEGWADTAIEKGHPSRGREFLVRVRGDVAAAPEVEDPDGSALTIWEVDDGRAHQVHLVVLVDHAADGLADDGQQVVVRHGEEGLGARPYGSGPSSAIQTCGRTGSWNQVPAVPTT